MLRPRHYGWATELSRIGPPVPNEKGNIGPCRFGHKSVEMTAHQAENDCSNRPILLRSRVGSRRLNRHVNRIDCCVALMKNTANVRPKLWRPSAARSAAPSLQKA